METRRMEIESFDKDFGAYLVIYTTECESWAKDGEKPLAVSIKSSVEFHNIGLEVTTDGRPFTDLKIGECVSDYDFGGEHRGVYVMRVG